MSHPRTLRFASALRSAGIAAGVSVGVAVGVLLGATKVANAQTSEQCNRGGGFGGNDVRGVYPNPKYDGRFTFARIAYAVSFGGRRGGGGGDPPWHHDYPKAERNFTRLLTQLSSVKGRTTESVVLTLDDPELFRFPIAYMSEPGYWYPNEFEVKGLREYLTKGGFLIFDDFYGNDIVNLQRQMERVLPNMRLIELGADHPIFDAFYRVRTLDFYHSYQCYKSEFYGIFVDNDPTKRMLAIVNQNSDMGETWEWSEYGMFPVSLTNETYKLGINYIIYSLTR